MCQRTRNTVLYCVLAIARIFKLALLATVSFFYTQLYRLHPTYCILVLSEFMTLKLQQHV